MSADLAYAGLARQAQLVRDGEVSSRELVELHLDRIARHDPRLNAFRVVLAEQALAQADQADARRKAGDDRPLLGVPIAIKDDIEMAGEVTSRGTNAYGDPDPADSELVRRLRSAGAVFVGKTNVPELEIIGVTESPTWGVTRNPWDLQRTSGGSSGGSASAVAAGLVPAAVASDGAGSIRIPAGCTALVGYKPQRGRVPVPAPLGQWNGMSTWGVLARRIEDVVLYHSVVDEPGLAPLEATPPGPLRVAVARNVAPGVLAKPDAEQNAAVDRAVEVLRGLGHAVEEARVDYGPTTGPNLITRYWNGITVDAGLMAHPERLSRRTKGYVRAGRAMAPFVERALRLEASDRERIERIYERFDLVLTPIFAKRPFRVMEVEGLGFLRTHQLMSARYPYAAAFNHTGQPAGVVPVGTTPDGFPLAVQLVAPTGQDSRLLGLVAQLQAELGWADWRPPAFAA